MIKLTIPTLVFLFCMSIKAQADFRIDEGRAVNQDRNTRSYITDVLGKQYSKSLSCQVQAGYGNSDLYYKNSALNLAHQQDITDVIAASAEMDFADTVQSPVVTKVNQEAYQKFVAQSLLQFDTDSWDSSPQCQALTSDILKSIQSLSDQQEQYYMIQIETRFGGARLMALVTESNHSLLLFGLTYAE